MIHEVFAPISDPQLAKTCSEIFTGEYRHIQDETEAAQYGAGVDLLTNPDVELLMLQASYMEGTPRHVLHNVFKVATFGPRLPSVEAVMDRYEDLAGKYQKWGTDPMIVNLMTGVKRFEGGWDTVRAWYGDEVSRQGRSLLSAYFVGRIASDPSALVDTIVYPNHIFQGVKTLVREGITSALPRMDPDLRSRMREHVLDNERVHTVVGDICASNTLLNTELLRNESGPYLQMLMPEQDT